MNYQNISFFVCLYISFIFFIMIQIYKCFIKKSVDTNYHFYCNKICTKNNIPYDIENIIMKYII
jgi:hypothetical protein